jgi:hypothetical protein
MSVPQIPFIVVFMTSTLAYSQTVQRIEQTASFIVKSKIEKVFPLFGPIREKEWATGWEPEIIYSNHPEVEEHMIFTTPGKLQGEQYIWVITQYRPFDFIIEYTVSARDRIWFITVMCESQDKDTKVTVTYSYTGFTEQANQLNQNALKNMFAHNLKDWEEAINFYLETGKRLE